jgi:hypothetical protein
VICAASVIQLQHHCVPPYCVRRIACKRNYVATPEAEKRLWRDIARLSREIQSAITAKPFTFLMAAGGGLKNLDVLPSFS